MHLLTLTTALSASSALTGVLAGGPTWCTLNDDCLGIADKIITRDCCRSVKHSARYDALFKVCVGNGGHPSNAVDHGAMAECCHARGARRMCGCKATPLLIVAKNREATHREWKAYNLHDRPEPNAAADPPIDAAAWMIPIGDPLMNSIHDSHMRKNGTIRRMPHGRAQDEDYKEWCTQPGK